MGLDMYLRAHRYLSSHRPEEKEVAEKIAELVGFQKPFEVRTISAIAVQWRKANQVHAWFVDNVQGGEDDCREYDVDTDQLEQLLQLCDKVLTTRDTSLLPPSDGFFFGSTKIDDWYWQDVQETRDGLRVALDAMADSRGGWFSYQASW